MKTATVTIKGITPFSSSAALKSERPNQEQHEVFERRVWRERANTDKDGVCLVPAMAFKNSITEAAKYLSLKVPGKRNATYTKHFVAGLYCDTPLSLGVKADETEGEWLHVPSNGVRGAGLRVWKCFPVFRSWGGVVQFHVLDETIKPEAFEVHLKAAGMFVGVGRFRPASNGFYGRFEVIKIAWS